MGGEISLLVREKIFGRVIIIKKTLFLVVPFYMHAIAEAPTDLTYPMLEEIDIDKELCDYYARSLSPAVAAVPVLSWPEDHGTRNVYHKKRYYAAKKANATCTNEIIRKKFPKLPSEIINRARIQANYLKAYLSKLNEEEIKEYARLRDELNAKNRNRGH